MCYVSFQFASNKQFPQDQDNTAVLGIPLAVMLYTVSRRKSLRYSDIYHIVVHLYFVSAPLLWTCGTLYLVCHTVSVAASTKPSLQLLYRICRMAVDSHGCVYRPVYCLIFWVLLLYTARCFPYGVRTIAARTMVIVIQNLPHCCRFSWLSIIVWYWLHCCRTPRSLQTVAARTTPSVLYWISSIAVDSHGCIYVVWSLHWAVARWGKQIVFLSEGTNILKPCEKLCSVSMIVMKHLQDGKIKEKKIFFSKSIYKKSSECRSLIFKFCKLVAHLIISLKVN